MFYWIVLIFCQSCKFEFSYFGDEVFKKSWVASSSDHEVILIGTMIWFHTGMFEGIPLHSVSSRAFPVTLICFFSAILRFWKSFALRHLCFIGFEHMKIGMQ
jgi:hypothetical protein